MLISEDYQSKLQAHVATKNPGWGNGGYMHCDGVRELAKRLIAEGLLEKPSNKNPIWVLDYGAGNGTFKSKLLGQKLQPFPMTVVEYDPARPEKCKMPEGQYDIVVNTDVLEHVEEDCLDDVLDSIRSKTKHAAYIAIALFKAAEVIKGVGGAHINLKPVEEWLPRLEKYFDVKELKFVKRGETPRVIHYECRPLDNVRQVGEEV